MIHKNLIFTSILTLLVLPSVVLAQPVEIKLDLKGNGWTMISLPLELGTPLSDYVKIDPNCKIIGGVLQYDTSQNKFLEVSFTINSLNDLSKSGKGFFIANGGTPCSITFKGEPLEFNTALPKGWNLVGGKTKFSSSCVLHDETWYDWSSGTGYKKASLPKLLETGLQSGKAYWIYVVNNECRIQSIKTTPSKQLRPNVFILEDDGTIAGFGKDLGINLAKKFYEKYPEDKYDFIGFHFLKDLGSGYTGEAGAFTVQNPVKGNFWKFLTFDSEYGSKGRLLGGYFLGSKSYDFQHHMELLPTSVPNYLLDQYYFDTILHEITHHWGVDVPISGVGAGHWSTVGSILGSERTLRKSIIETPDGKYVSQLNCVYEPRYHDFDLYSMGLKSADEIKDKLVGINDFAIFNGQTLCDSKIEIPSNIITGVYSIQDFIKVLGPRIPSVAEAQKDFTIAFVLIVPKDVTLSQKEIDALNWIADKVPVVWYKFTEGRSILNGIVPKDVTPPIISNAKLSATKSSIEVTWTTNEPAAHFVIYRSFNYNFISPQTSTNPPKFSTTHEINIESSDLTPLSQNTEYTVKIISIDQDYNMASFDAGKVKTLT